MNIGIVTLWFERGQYYLARIIEQAIEGNVFFLARPDMARKIRRDWSYDNVTFTQCYYIENREIEGWVKENKLDLVIFIEEQYQVGLVRLLKDKVKTWNVIMWEWLSDEFIKDELPRYDRIIAPTQACYNLLKRYLDNVSLLKFSIPSKERNFEITDEVIFYHPSGWGGAYGRRGTEYVVDAFKRVGNKDKMKLVVSRQIQSSYKEKWESEKIEFWLGNFDKDEIEGLYQKAHVCVLPSLWEGLGLTFLEALSYGIPIVTVNAAPMNEYVWHRYNGILCEGRYVERPPHVYIRPFLPDIHNLSFAIEQLGTNVDLVKSMSENAKKVYEKEYNWVKFKEKINSYIKEDLE